MPIFLWGGLQYFAVPSMDFYTLFGGSSFPAADGAERWIGDLRRRSVKTGSA